MSKNPSNLVLESILEIRRLRSEGMLPKQIAGQFGVSVSAVHRALNNDYSEARAQAVIDLENQLNANSRKRGDGSSRRPLHLEKYHQARRGFHVPDHLEDRYFDLLKSGIPIADARRQMGLSCGS